MIAARRSAALAAAAFLACGPAAAQTSALEQALAPFAVVGGQIASSQTGYSASGVKLAGAGITIDISKMRAIPTAGGGWTLQLAGATLRPAAAALAGTSLTIGPSTLELEPGSDPSCPIARVAAFNFSQGVERSNGTAVATTFKNLVGTVSKPAGCLTDFDVSLGSLAIKDTQSGQFSFSGLTLSGRKVPLSSAGTRSADETRIKLHADASQYQIADMLPVWTTGSLDVDARARTPTLVGITQLLENLRPLDPGPAAGELRLMQAYNALTMLAAHVQASAADVSVSAAGAVPVVMVANFGQAGLSVMHGTGQVTFDLGQGAAQISSKLRVIGVADLGLDILGQILPYDRKKIALALQRKPLGFHLIPSAAIKEAQVSFLDTGFHTAAINILGVPAQDYLDGIAATFAQKEGGENAFISATLKRLSNFLRRDYQVGQSSATHEPTVARITPQPAASLIDIMLAALSPSAKNVTGLNFRLTP